MGVQFARGAYELNPGLASIAILHVYSWKIKKKKIGKTLTKFTEHTNDTKK